MGKIRTMSETLAKKIRAGEVIDGPHSVLKELLDNALDAGSTSITVHLDRGGLRNIRVADNGEGMDAEDAEACLLRHATSKVYTEADLDSIGTLGFRGEALAVIFSVAQITIQTCPVGAPVGSRVSGSGGMNLRIAPVARTPGTTVEVENLFFNTPARQKHCATPRAEEGRCVKVFRQIALAHPDVEFRLYCDGSEKAFYRIVPSHKDRISDVYGAAFAQSLIAIEGARKGIRVYGYVGSINDPVSSNRKTALFVNRRPVTPHVLKATLRNALGSALPGSQTVEAFVYVEIGADQVDLNVSPDKSEVKFQIPGKVWAAVTEALRESLKSSENAPTWRINPGSPLSFQPGEASSESSLPASQPSPSAKPPQSLESLDFEALFEEASSKPLRFVDQLPANPKILFQAANTFLIAVTDQALLIVDQHAVHERIQYERLRSRWERDQESAESAPLMLPITLDLELDEIDTLERNAGFVNKVGFVIEPAGPSGTRYWIQEIPATLQGKDVEKAFRKLLSEIEKQSRFSDGSDNTSRAITPQEDRVLMTLACHGAIRAGQPLQEEAIRQLWKDLMGVDLAAHDVHGRPAILVLPYEEIAMKMVRCLV